MFKKGVAIAALLLVASAGQAMAQGAEIGVTAGWTFSDGVSGDPFLAPNLEVYDRLDPKDSFNWGFNVGVPVGRNLEVGFLFGQQMSALVADGTTETEVGDMNVNTYHGYFAYNVGEFDAPVRPYFMFGLGATSFASVPFTAGGANREVDGFTGFSTTWGAGVKVYGSSNLGFKAGIQWTPTYIKSDAAGYWCDPWWGCYVIGDAQYANQWQFNGGLLLRF
jgi:hypothetical protein